MSATPPSVATLSLGATSPTTSSTNTTPTTFVPPPYAAFPPFYTLQPNLATRARQLELWAEYILSYCAHHRLFRLALSSLPPDLFSHAGLRRALKPADIRTVLDYMSRPPPSSSSETGTAGPRVEWISPTTRGERPTSAWVFWRALDEWADALLAWVDDTGQKGAVLTVYELRAGEGVVSQPWAGIDEALLRKVLQVLVKRGKAQVFGQEDGAGVKFF